MSTPVVRPTVRVLLMARDGEATRVLLFRAYDGYWFPPGGGVEGTETDQQAALRELAEETGLTGVGIGPHIWNRRDVFEWHGSMLDVRERWYLARIPDVVPVDPTGWTPEEHDDLTAHRWWSLPELEATTEPLVPRSLARLVRGLIREGAPAEPLDVGA